LTKISDIEINSARKFLKTKEIPSDKLKISNIKKAKHFKDYDLLWIHSVDTAYGPMPSKKAGLILDFVHNGGSLILTLESAMLLTDLGLETTPPEVKHKLAEDQGYGRKLGMHAFRSHPVFEGMHGGSYFLKPHRDTTVRIIGYFDENLPENGKVIAVDWDYIFLRENNRLMLEYEVGKGKILVIGGYTCFASPNLNNTHLEKLMENCINYLSGETFVDKKRYWSYDPQTVKQDTSIKLKDERQFFQTSIYSKGDIMMLSKDSATKQYWDIAGERIVIMGMENGGIDEIWAHPYMAFRDYNIGLRLKGEENIQWLNKLNPALEIRPTSFTRAYNINGTELKETITCSSEDPAGRIDYELFSDDSIELVIRFSSNMRLMWPYSEFVYNQLLYNYDTTDNCFTFSNEENTSIGYYKTDNEPLYYKAGQFRSFEFSDDLQVKHPINPVLTNEFLVSGMFVYDLSKYKKLAISLGVFDDATNESQTHRLESRQRKEHYALEKGLKIVSPDNRFNEAYNWALASSESFYVNTPEIGKSLVAGYGTTTKGWNGGHEINGRPGYAWYFGRDGQWSAFALLDYGDFEKVKNILDTYIRFQDLNGKIYHEISTSGAAHYDAADATPLFITLAGKYMKHSGDTSYIKENWGSIKKAIDYCYSTDTDNDLLIENTNVGHGWVEGGGLFGSHSSLYLTSCWAAALNEGADMAAITGFRGLGDEYAIDAKEVTTLINTLFFNDQKRYYYHGLKQDQAFIEEKSILPCIPIHFGQIPSTKRDFVLNALPGSEYSTDWGCRILSNKSKLYNPRGYHSGSVWPLFTGWVSLAEYKSRKSIQGFTHLMNNVNIYDNWAKGKLEEVLHGETYTPSGVNAHQCWSETMIIQPTIEGMLGLEVDALKNTIKLAPQFPSNWDTVIVKNIRMGSTLLKMSMTRTANKVSYSFSHNDNEKILLDFSPVFEKGTMVNFVEPDIPATSWKSKSDGSLSIKMSNELLLEFELKNGVSVIPVLPDPGPGAVSESVKILNEYYDNNKYSIEVDAIPNKETTFEVFIRDQEILSIVNGELLKQNGSLYTIRVKYNKQSDNYLKQFVVINLK